MRTRRRAVANRQKPRAITSNRLERCPAAAGRVPVPAKNSGRRLHYNDHLEESGLKKAGLTGNFARFATSLIAHQEPIQRPRESTRRL